MRDFIDPYLILAFWTLFSIAAGAALILLISILITFYHLIEGPSEDEEQRQ